MVSGFCAPEYSEFNAMDRHLMYSLHVYVYIHETERFFFIKVRI